MLLGKLIVPGIFYRLSVVTDITVTDETYLFSLQRIDGHDVCATLGETI
jgi:hypothetical protein